MPRRSSRIVKQTRKNYRDHTDERIHDIMKEEERFSKVSVIGKVKYLKLSRRIYVIELIKKISTGPTDTHLIKVGYTRRTLKRRIMELHRIYPEYNFKIIDVYRCENIEMEQNLHMELKKEYRVSSVETIFGDGTWEIYEIEDIESFNEQINDMI